MCIKNKIKSVDVALFKFIECSLISFMTQIRFVNYFQKLIKYTKCLPLTWVAFSMLSNQCSINIQYPLENKTKTITWKYLN